MDNPMPGRVDIVVHHYTHAPECCSATNPPPKPPPSVSAQPTVSVSPRKPSTSFADPPPPARCSTPILSPNYPPLFRELGLGQLPIPNTEPMGQAPINIIGAAGPCSNAQAPPEQGNVVSSTSDMGGNPQPKPFVSSNMEGGGGGGLDLRNFGDFEALLQNYPPGEYVLANIPVNERN